MHLSQALAFRIVDGGVFHFFGGNQAVGFICCKAACCVSRAILDFIGSFEPKFKEAKSSPEAVKRRGDSSLSRRRRAAGSAVCPPIILCLPQLIPIAVEDWVSAVSRDIASRRRNGFLAAADIVSYT